MPRISRMPLPAQARLWALVQPGDFIDGYSVASPLTPRAAARAAFSMPGWARALMALRDALVKPLGLKTGAGGADDSETVLFPVTFEDDHELILGTDDRHLNFRITILRQDGQIHMATWVHRNNLAGRIYLALVMPFHRLLTRNAMRRVAHPPKGAFASLGSSD